MSAWRKRWRERSPVDPRDPCFRAEFTSVREAIQAGIIPTATPVAIEASRVNTSTLALMGIGRPSTPLMLISLPIRRVPCGGEQH